MAKNFYQDMLENRDERQWKNSSLVTSALATYQQEQVLRKEPNSDERLGALIHSTLEEQQQKKLISPKERNTQCSSISFTEVQRRENGCHQWTARGSCSKGRHCSFEHDKGKKENGRYQEVPDGKPNPLTDNI